MAEPVTVNQERLVQTFLDMVRVNTPPKHEKAASEIACKILIELGFECTYDDAGEKVGGNVGNLIAFKKGTVKNAPTIFFSAHFDTVEATPGLEPIIDGDVIRTDGKTVLGADDISGMAPILEGMRLLQEQNVPHGDIQLLLTICEEIGLVGAKHLDPSRIKAKFGYVLDAGPPVGSLVYSAPTQDIFDVWIHGRPAHAGAQPEDGTSAILVAARAISRMRLGRIDHETTANVGVIGGGTATNIIPAECHVKCEARSRNLAKMEKQRDHMIACFQEEADAAGITLDIKNENAYPAYELKMDDEVLTVGIAAAERIGLEPLLRATGGGGGREHFQRRRHSDDGAGLRHDEYSSARRICADFRPRQKHPACRLDC